MNDLQRQVRIAQRRLLWQKFLTVVSYSLFGALLLAAILVGVDARFKPWGDFHAQVANLWWFLGGGAVLGLAVATVWSAMTRPKLLEAAIELDRRFTLRERVSSALSLPESDRESPAGQALVADAMRRVQKVDVADGFAVRLRPTALLPLAPVALAFGLAFLPALLQNNTVEANSTNPVLQITQKKPLIKAIQDLKKKSADAEKEGLKQAPDSLKKLEKGLQELEEKKDLKRKDALVSLNKLQEELEKRRDELGGNDKLKEQLKDRLKDVGNGPGEKMADALKNGDFDKAMKEMQKLKDQLKNNQLDEKAKQDLAKQMEQMQDKLQKLADAHQNMQKNLEEQVNQARQQGNNEQAEKLMDQLKQMKQQQAQMDQLKNLAEKMGQCQQCLQQGDKENAMQQLEQAMNQLEQMAQNEAERQMIQDAMDQLADCKNGMCNMPGNKQNNKQGDQPGNGLGRGQGQGERPENETATKTYDTRAPSKFDKNGKLIVTGFTKGENVSGDYQKTINEQVKAATVGEVDPLTNQRLPRNQRDHVGEYFNQLRDK